MSSGYSKEVIIIGIIFGKIKNVQEVKKQIVKQVKCPLCEMDITLGIEKKIRDKVKSSHAIYFPHIHLHGRPLHALICYISPTLKIRNIGVIESLEISRDSTTFAEIMKKWANPY